jgi:hypothetical protein
MTDASTPTPSMEPENQTGKPSVQNAYTPFPVTDNSHSAPIEPKKPRKKLWLILGTIAGILVVCCISAIVIAVIGGIRSAQEREPIEKVLDTYMKYMVQKDIENAYGLFSSRAKRQFATSKLQEMIEGNNYVIFEGYQSLSVDGIHMTQSVNTNPDIPQGLVTNVNGTISYEDDFKGSFTGTLEKVNGEWQIDGVFISVPPNKFK